MLAGTNGDPLDQAAVPFWFLCLLMAVAWVFGYRAHSRRGGQYLVTSFLPFGVLYLLALCVSPAAFGGGDAGFLNLSWIGPQAIAAFDRPGFTTNLLLLFGLLAFLWWRGIVIAAGAPATSVVLRRFGISLGLLLLAVIGLNAVQPAVSDPYGAALTLLVIGDVFCGLLSAAMSHLDVQRRDSSAAGEKNDTRWIGIALLVDVVVVLVALFASLIVNFESFLSLLGYLGPVGQVIGTVLSWLVGILVRVLDWLLTPILSLFISSSQRARLLSPPRAPFRCMTVLVHGKPVLKCGNPQATTSPLFTWLVRFGVALVVLVVLALVGLILYLAVRRVLARPAQSEDNAMADEREALDGRTLFAAQLRSLFGRRRRGAPAPDPLQRGTVRYMYRDVLRAAASRGLGRASTETPAEYAQRLSGTPPLAVSSSSETSDLLALSDAYDDARYADREPDESVRASLHERTSRLVRFFIG